MLKTNWRNNTYWGFIQNHIEHSPPPVTSQNGLNYTAIDFNEKAKHNLGLQTNFTFFSRPLNTLLAILKNILERYKNGLRSK